MSSVVSEKLIIFKPLLGGYLIGPAMIIGSFGLDYLYMLLQNPGKYISCTGLETGYEPSEEDIQAHHALDELGVYGHVEGSMWSRQETSDPVTLSQYRARAKELERKDSLNPQEAFELNALKKELGNTYHGKSKGFTDESKKRTDRVTKAIKREIIKLIANPEIGVMLIGVHFKDNIEIGCECRYVGNKQLGF